MKRLNQLLVTHIQTHNGKNVYRCLFCEREKGMKLWHNSETGNRHDGLPSECKDCGNPRFWEDY